MHRSTIPGSRKARTEDTLTLQSVRCDTIQALDKGTGRDAGNIGKITIAFTCGNIHLR